MYLNLTSASYCSHHTTISQPLPLRFYEAIHDSSNTSLISTRFLNVYSPLLQKQNKNGNEDKPELEKFVSLPYN